MKKIKKACATAVSVLLLVLVLEAALMLLSGSSVQSPSDGCARYYTHYEPITAPFISRKTTGGETLFRFVRGHSSARPAFGLKKDGEFRVMVLGESMAESLADFFEHQDAVSGREANFINAGMRGYTSGQIFSAAREISRLDADAVLLVMGNNLFRDITLTDWRKYRNPPPLRHLYRISRIYRIVTNALYSLPGRGLYGISEFARDYEGILNMLSDRGIPVIAVTLPVNYAGWPPAVSLRLRHFIPMMLTGQGHYQEALEVIEPESDALLWFFKGKALAASGRYREARDSFLQALMLDPSGSRATDEINDIIRSLSRKYDVELIEADRIFESLSENGLLGVDYFPDNCHWYPSYSALVADGFFRALRTQPGVTIPGPEERNLYRKSAERDIADYDFLRDAVSESRRCQRIYPENSLPLVYLFRNAVRYNRLETMTLLETRPSKDADTEILKGWYLVLTHAGEAFRMEKQRETARMFLDAAIDTYPASGPAYFFRALLNLDENSIAASSRDLIAYGAAASCSELQEIISFSSGGNR